MSKSALNTAGNLAFSAKSIYKMIKAFLRGGWYAAAIEAVKQYWPQLLCVSLAVTLLPVIVFFSLPVFLLRLENPSDAEMAAFNEKADAAARYFDNYTDYYKEFTEIAGSDGQTGDENNTDIPVEALSVSANDESGGTEVPENTIIQKKGLKLIQWRNILV